MRYSNDTVLYWPLFRDRDGFRNRHLYRHSEPFLLEGIIVHDVLADVLFPA